MLTPSSILINTLISIFWVHLKMGGFYFTNKETRGIQFKISIGVSYIANQRLKRIAIDCQKELLLLNPYIHPNIN